VVNIVRPTIVKVIGSSIFQNLHSEGSTNVGELPGILQEVRRCYQKKILGCILVEKLNSLAQGTESKTQSACENEETKRVCSLSFTYSLCFGTRSGTSAYFITFDFIRII